jgi:hypothetical protein
MDGGGPVGQVVPARQTQSAAGAEDLQLRQLDLLAVQGDIQLEAVEIHPAHLAAAGGAQAEGRRVGFGAVGPQGEREIGGRRFAECDLVGLLDGPQGPFRRVFDGVQGRSQRIADGRLRLRRRIIGAAAPEMDAEEIGRKLAQEHFARVGGKPHPDPLDGDFARALARADAVPAQARAHGAVFDGQDRHHFAPAQQGDGIERHGELRRFQEGLGSVRGQEGADLAGHQAPVDFQRQAFDLQVVAELRHAVEKAIGEIGRQADEVQIGEQRSRQQQQREERAQDPVGRMAERHQQERREPPAPGTAFRGRAFRTGIHGRTS